MAGTNGIYVQTFHGHYVLQHFFLADGSAGFLTEIMTVHTMEDNSVAIDKQCPVISDAYGTEAYLAATKVYYLVAPFQCQCQVIQLGCFCAPGFYAIHVDDLCPVCRAQFLACLC